MLMAPPSSFVEIPLNSVFRMLSLVQAWQLMPRPETPCSFLLFSKLELALTESSALFTDTKLDPLPSRNLLDSMVTEPLSLRMYTFLLPYKVVPLTAIY